MSFENSMAAASPAAGWLTRTRALALVAAVVTLIAAALALTRTPSPAALRPGYGLVAPDIVLDTALHLPPPTVATRPQPDVKLWGKIVVTAILGLAALFVVLSRRYDDATQKWAVSVLTLIAGVWIGSAI